jgi:translation initiation factor IF-2
MEKETLKKQPVVVILGHVDSGKTSLLNTIRNLNFTEEKPGGIITQEIGAFEVEREGKKITFIDTPGHEAFSQMRSRGAKVADVAVLVVDSVEGVKEQTKEAIAHIKEAKIPFVVALNKIDKPEANPEKAKRELAQNGVLVESLGGEIPSVETSAKTGQGIKELLDLILLLTEMENLMVEINVPARGVVIESSLDKKRGATATLVVEEGILEKGNIVGTSSSFGKIKKMEDFEGKEREKAFPGQAVMVLGFEKTPVVGENFKVFQSLEEAKAEVKIVEERKIRPEKKEGKVLNLILKTDCFGSKEAIEEMLEKIPKEKIALNLLKSEVGEINENDLKLAETSGAIVLGFRTKENKVAKELMERKNFQVFKFKVIYELFEGLKKIIERTLEPEIVRVDLGKVKVLVDFWREKNRQIVGGRIIEGEVKRGTLIEVFREEELVAKGRLINLQKNKKDIEEAKKGEEIGILYEGEGKIKEGDILLIYLLEKRKISI